MNDSKRVWVWVGVVVVVIAIAAAFILGYSPKPSGPVPVFAPQGQLVPNFPKQLILDPQAQVNSSYSVNYNKDTNQYTAEWTSSTSLPALYADYQAYFSQNGWMVTNQSGASAGSGLAVLYAATSTADANVTIVAEGYGSDATVSYVPH